MKWTLIHPRMTEEALGHIPYFMNEHDPRPAREQINEHYISGWIPFEGFTLTADNALKYPGDPPLKCVAMTKLRDETILFYTHSWLAIKQPDGSFEVARLD